MNHNVGLCFSFSELFSIKTYLILGTHQLHLKVNNWDVHLILTLFEEHFFKRQRWP